MKSINKQKSNYVYDKVFKCFLYNEIKKIISGGWKMKGIVYGYVRVSTRDQNEARQLIAMLEFGIEEKNIYTDKQSGRDFNRPQYKKLIRKLKAGDTLVIKSIDRLGRNYEEIIEQWRVITKEKQAAIVVLDMPLLDTRQGRDLTGTLIADIVLQLLSYVAQTEREFIKRRQAEGIAAAKARGVRFGSKPKKKPDNFSECRRKWEQGEISAREAGRRLNISHKTFLSWVKNN
jgi:DNA invertase Pin-like site-specific DNA recombinase